QPSPRKECRDVPSGSSRTAIMAVLRTALTWLVAASYLCASTLSAALHDHRDCCENSVTGQHPCGVHGDGHCHAGHTRHHHNTAHATASGDQCQPGAMLHATHPCAVCEFLVQAPLASPTSPLIPSGESPPVAAPHAALVVETGLAGTLLPRGPP